MKKILLASLLVALNTSAFASSEVLSGDEYYNLSKKVSAKELQEFSILSVVIESMGQNKNKEIKDLYFKSDVSNASCNQQYFNLPKDIFSINFPKLELQTLKFQAPADLFIKDVSNASCNQQYFNLPKDIFSINLPKLELQTLKFQAPADLFIKDDPYNPHPSTPGYVSGDLINRS